MPSLSTAKAQNIIKIAIGEIKKKRKRRRTNRKPINKKAPSSTVGTTIQQPIYSLGSRHVFPSGAPPIPSMMGQRDVSVSQVDMVREKRIEALTQSVKKLQEDVLKPKAERIKEAKKNADLIDIEATPTKSPALSGLTTPKSTTTGSIASIFKSARQSQVMVLPPQQEEEMEDILVEEEQETPFTSEPTSQKKLKRAIRISEKRRLVFELDKIYNGYVRNGRTGKNVPKEQWIEGENVRAEDLKDTIARQRGSDYAERIVSSDPEFVPVVPSYPIIPMGEGRMGEGRMDEFQREEGTSTFEEPQRRQGRRSLLSLFGGGEAKTS